MSFAQNIRRLTTSVLKTYENTARRRHTASQTIRQHSVSQFRRIMSFGYKHVSLCSLFALLHCLHAIQFTCPPGTQKGSEGWPCLRDDDGNVLTMKVVFMDEPGATTNAKAVGKAAQLGRLYTCDDPELAVPECFEYENWNQGWVGAVGNRILKELGVNVIAMTRANFSAEGQIEYTGGSSYTRCVWDVKLGKVDLCIGDFWETPQRRNLTAFTSPFDNDLFYLYTPSVPNPATDFNLRSLLIIFQPFENPVWLCIFFVLVFCSVANWITEAGHNTEDVPKGPQGLFQTCYFAIMGFVGGDLPATVWSSRIISIGFMIFIFIHTTAYTASLATTLVTYRVPFGEVSSLQDLVMKGKRLCVYGSMAAASSDIFASDIQLVQMDSYGTIMEKLYEGNCSGAVMGKIDAVLYTTASRANFTMCLDPRDDNNFGTCSNASILPKQFILDPNECGDNCFAAKRYCNFIRLNDPTISQLSLAFSLPVQKDLERHVSAAIVSLTMQGYARQAQQEQVFAQNPNICEPPPPPTLSLTIQQMSGVYFFSGILIILGIFAHAAELLAWGCNISTSYGNVEAAAATQSAIKRAPSFVDGEPSTPTAAGGGGRRKSMTMRQRNSLSHLRQRQGSTTGVAGCSGGAAYLLAGRALEGLDERRDAAEAALLRLLETVRSADGHGHHAALQRSPSMGERVGEDGRMAPPTAAALPAGTDLPMG